MQKMSKGPSDIRAAMIPETRKQLAPIPMFSPEEGRTILEPQGSGAGFWVGAPSILVDPITDSFFLSYRVRRPKPERGVETRIAQSDDGIHFRDVFSLHKDALNSESIERCALTLGLDGVYRLYISYVDPSDRRWRIDVLNAESPTGFKVSERQKVLTADDIDAEGVKDPVVYTIGQRYYAIVSYAPRPVDKIDQDELHGTGDVYNTGHSKSHTGLAVSDDGVSFTWLGDILSPSEDGWDAYAARISTLLYKPPYFIAYYDGSRSVKENYEEKTGVAIGTDIRHFERSTTQGPMLIAPHATGSLRYMEAVPFSSSIYFYYEYVRPDGSHELRLSVVDKQ